MFHLMRSGLLAPAVALALLSTPALTQAQASPGDDRLEEITVTANKRDESLSKVGASISAFTGAMLEDRNITRPEELAQTVPGLALAPSTHGTPVYTLRGVGYNADALGVYPAVSVSLDQAPMPFPVLASHTLYDLERVEVLKGPQGTLFGQNSTGGAINYVAAKPTDTLQAGLSASYGRFSEVHGTGYISGPLAEGFGLRVAVDAGHRGNWQDNFVRTPADNSQIIDLRNGEQDYVAGRMILDWKAGDDLKFELNVNGSSDRSDPQALQIIAVMPSVPAAPSDAELNAVLVPRDDLRAANWSTDEGRPAGNRRLFQTFLRADYEISDAIALTSISAYNRLRQKMAFDLDGSDFQMVDGPQDNGNIDDYSEELRLSNASGASQTFRWTVGGNYNKSRIHEDQWITYKDNSLSNAGNLFINVSGINSRANIENWAVFVNGEDDLTGRLTFKTGARYTKSTNETSICGYSPGDHAVARLFEILGQLLGGQSLTLGPTDCYTLNAQLLPGSVFDYTLAESNVSWKAGLDFKLDSATLLYTNVSKGYKAGSFPAITASTQDVLKPAKQESVTSFEMGFKTRLADDIVQLTGAVFYQDYRDKQVQGTVSTALFGLLQQLQNIPKSHIFGVETDLTLRPLRGLTLTASGSYLKTKVDQYTSISVFGDQTDFKGDRLPFAPEWTLIGDVDYQLPTSAGGTIFIGGSVNYRTSVDAYVGASRLAFPTNQNGFRSVEPYPFLIDGYTTVDARIGYDFPGNKVTVSAWGKNIFNEFSIQNVISYNDIITRSTGQPATYGVSLKVHW